jgi:hypothetical protein
MPEYLAPAVYVEEVDTGSKPIEGVSTSTTGMVGVTERGPVGVPILVTSYGEYVRWFGGRLGAAEFPGHCYLPHAAEGFFTNGGKRLFVTRVLDAAAATRAQQPLFDRGNATSIRTALLRAAPGGSGTAAVPPSLVILQVTGAAVNDWIRIGDGSSAEYRRLAAVPVTEDVMVPLALPLSRSHAPGGAVLQLARAAAGAALQLDAAARAGDANVVVRGATADVTAFATAVVGPNQCVEIGGANLGEYRFVLEATQLAVSGANATVRLRLDAPLLLARAAGAGAVRIDLSGGAVATDAVQSAAAGSAMLFVGARGGDFDDRTTLVHLQGAGQEVRRIGQLTRAPIAGATGMAYPAGALVAAVAVAPFRPAITTVVSTTVLAFASVTGFVRGQRVIVNPGGANGETVTVTNVDAATNRITVTPALAGVPAHAAGEPVQPVAASSTAAAAAGARVLPLEGRLGLAVGDVVLVGAGATAQYVTVVSLPASSGVAPDPGNVVVFPALAAAWPVGTAVTRQNAPAPIAGRQDTALAVDTATGADTLLLTDGNAFAPAEVVRVTTPAGETLYHVIEAAPATQIAQQVTLTAPLRRAHAAGALAAGRTPLFDVEAIDAGSWGNRIRVSVADEPDGLASRTRLAAIVDSSTVRLASAAGVQPGTVLELVDPATGQVVGGPVKVANVNRAANYALLLAAPLTAAQQVVGLGVRSREFSLTVRVLRQPDPATPSRNDQVETEETFRYLSMDPRHSNYFERVIGATNGPLRLADRRPEGAAAFVRVRDRATTAAALHGVRLGPEALVDVLPSGLERPARHALEQVLGSDSIATLAAEHYLGNDDPNPENRTGIQALRNIEEISIVAAPGQTVATVQNALIGHCELMRYRFAVLDGNPPPNDTLAGIQAQRQQYDTKYAALYHPWLLVPDPYPSNPAQPSEYPIPPSGHMLGIYARTDIERGVHKAPANEVVRGVIGLQRLLNKEQHDILNPYPVNINVIRDFRPNNRGIRVYGGRCITSDSDWKYVNVRRLLIFIEASIDRGLQWVVFEPNAEPLWARVRRAITNFLTLVWRNGALEGTKVEEAFFVKCDRTTMTQTDIDQGRLICLVGVAPVKPAEFVIVRIGLWTAHAEE